MFGKKKKTRAKVAKAKNAGNLGEFDAISPENT